MAEIIAPVMVTVYVVHDFIDPMPMALFLNRGDATGLSEDYPRSYIHEVQIDAARWVGLDELKAENIGSNQI